MNPCPACVGTGAPERASCTFCGGTGRVFAEPGLVHLQNLNRRHHQMNTQEAIEEARALVPGSSVIVTKQVQFTLPHNCFTTEYRVSLLPWKDCECQQFSGQSFEKCIQLLKSELHEPIAVPNVE